MEELWTTYIQVGKKLVEYFEFDNKIEYENVDYSKYNFETSNIKVCNLLDLYESKGIDFYNLEEPNPMLHLPYISNYEEGKAKQILSELRLFNFESYDSDLIKEVVGFCISMFLLVQMYICFRDSKRNTHLVEKLFIFFDNTDSSNFKGRYIKNTSTQELKLIYLKIKFVWLFNSLATYLFTNIHSINSDYDQNYDKIPFFWINGIYLKIDTYIDNEIEVPNKFYTNDIPSNYQKEMKKNPILYVWHSFYRLLSDKKTEICNKCFTIFEVNTKPTKTCYKCIADCENDNIRKKLDFLSNKEKINFISRELGYIEKYLTDEQREVIKKMITDINKAKRTPKEYKLNEYYDIVAKLLEQHYPAITTYKKGSLIY